MKHVVAIYRAERFSPNSVEKDRAIIEAVGKRLAQKGYEVEYISECELDESHEADIYLSMGRLASTIDFLKHKEDEGAITINTAEGVESCSRSEIDRIMRINGIPAAPMSGTDGYWIKRGDEVAQSKDDVVYARNEEEKEARIKAFRQRGISDIVVTAHLKGDLVKFYGVQGTGFFRMFYPSDDGQYKFEDEKMNGSAHHYAFNSESLHRDAERLSSLTGAEIYGGDCIVGENGTYAIIDFNDWPSFSRCLNGAADAIAERVMMKIRKRTKADSIAYMKETMA